MAAILYTAGHVNIHGKKWTPGMCAKESIVAPPPKKAAPRTEYHKGWRVVGIPPGAMEAARDEHAIQFAKAQRGDKVEKEFRVAGDHGAWLARFRKKPVRSKAYEIPQAADDCKALAERCGWTHVEIVTLTKQS